MGSVYVDDVPYDRVDLPPADIAFGYCGTGWLGWSAAVAWRCCCWYCADIRYVGLAPDEYVVGMTVLLVRNTLRNSAR